MDDILEYVGFDKQLDQTIKAVKENYYNYKLYIECKKELEEAGFIILEPDNDCDYPKVVKEV